MRDRVPEHHGTVALVWLARPGLTGVWERARWGERIERWRAVSVESNFGRVFAPHEVSHWMEVRSPDGMD